MKSMVRIPKWTRVIAAGMTVFAASCTILDLDSRAEERERLASNRRLWESQGVDSYEFVLQRLCFCGGGTSPSRVLVRNGIRVSVTDVATGDPIPEPFVQYYLTIPELFDFIEDAIERKAHSIDVTYDRTWGFPSSISIDYEEMAIDEEMAFEAGGFKAER